MLFWQGHKVGGCRERIVHAIGVSDPILRLAQEVCYLPGAVKALKDQDRAVALNCGARVITNIRADVPERQIFQAYD